MTTTSCSLPLSVCLSLDPSRIETASPRLPARFEIRSAPLSSDKSIGLKARFRATTAGHREFLCFSVYTNTGGSSADSRWPRPKDYRTEGEGKWRWKGKERERDSGNRWLDVSIKNSFRHTDRYVPIKEDWTRWCFWRYVILMFVICCWLGLFWIRVYAVYI